MAKARGKAFWKRLVGEVVAGATKEAVASRHQVSQGWLSNWCRRLEKEVAPPAFLPVQTFEQVREKPPVQEGSRRLELTVGPVRLSFEEGTNPAYVGQIARLLAP